MMDLASIPHLKPNRVRLSFTALLLALFIGLLGTWTLAELGLAAISESDLGLFRVLSPLLAFTCFFLHYSLFRTIVSVKANPMTRSLHLKTILGKEFYFPADHLHGFSAMTGADGIILYTKDGRHFQLSEWSTTSVIRFAEALKQRGISFLGFEWVWWPFGKSKYRFDPK